MLKLKPKDFYAAFKLIHQSRAGVCSIKKLAEAPADAADLEKPLKQLEKVGILKINGEGTEAVVVMEKPMTEFSIYIQAYAEQIELLPNGAQPPVPKKKSKKDDMNKIMFHYAKAKGIDDDDLDVWVGQEYKRNARSIVRLLSASGSVGKACEIIDTVKEMLEKRGMDWSLNGAVINRMHGILRKQKLGGRKWDW